MLHELFITHCTNGTSIMNPFTFIKGLIIVIKVYKAKNFGEILVAAWCVCNSHQLNVSLFLYVPLTEFVILSEFVTLTNSRKFA